MGAPRAGLSGVAGIPSSKGLQIERVVRLRM
jgi:hypothetical protein